MRLSHCLIIALTLCLPSARAAGPVHSVVDIAHEFSFYFDGRFARNYLSAKGNVNVQNWATLHKADLGNVNLLILPTGATCCPYTPKDIAAVKAFLEGGGGVLLLGDHALFRTEKTYRLNEMATPFGAAFANQRAKAPLSGVDDLKYYGGKTLSLAKPDEWEILVKDATGQPITVRKQVGKGKLLVASRGLSGRQPDAKDPINAAWWTPLLTDLANGKTVDPRRRPRGMSPENEEKREGLTIRYSDYMKPDADAIFGVYQ
ncbi:hypothetical protein HQ560_08500, partial [bacterium]|nr:hypothetical protein [bacterium]